jgi:hypothetical protein
MAHRSSKRIPSGISSVMAKKEPWRVRHKRWFETLKAAVEVIPNPLAETAHTPVTEAVE